MGVDKKHRNSEPINFEEYLDEEIREQPVGIKPRVISIRVGEIETTARLEPTPAAQQLWHVLPITASAKVWGQEVYLKVPFTCSPDELCDAVEPGEIGYWPEGDCLCIFYGDKPNSPVDILGSVHCDPDLFRAVEEGQEIHVARVE